MRSRCRCKSTAQVRQGLHADTQSDIPLQAAAPCGSDVATDPAVAALLAVFRDTVLQPKSRTRAARIALLQGRAAGLRGRLWP